MGFTRPAKVHCSLRHAGEDTALSSPQQPLASMPSASPSLSCSLMPPVSGCMLACHAPDHAISHPAGKMNCVVLWASRMRLDLSQVTSPVPASKPCAYVQAGILSQV